MSLQVGITGATGFVGGHVALAFLAAGHSVRALVRSPDDPKKVGFLQEAAARGPGSLSLVRADLAEPDSFVPALEGCTHLVHVAAVARLAAPDPQRQIVDPSVRGTQAVLAAATRAGVRRVVLTSSVAAIGSYRDSSRHPLTEADWNDRATLQTDPYGLAKTSAERLAWDQAGQAPWKLVCINPTMVLGPVLAPAHRKASPITVFDLLRGTFPGVPKISFGIVDAREVAAAHLAAATQDAVVGRHLLCAGVWSMQEMAQFLAEQFPERRVRTWPLPNLVLHLAALFDRRLSRAVLADVLDRRPRYDGQAAPAALGFHYRPISETVRDTARSLVESGALGPA